MTKINSYMNQTEPTDNIGNLQDMCNNVLFLYNAHAKGNQELTDLANITGYMLWSYTKSLIALKYFQNAPLRHKQDFAIGELCVVINECTKKIIGFRTGKARKESLWIDKIGRYITRHPELTQEYNSLKEGWISYADTTDIQMAIKDVRSITIHGVEKVDELIKLHDTSTSDVIDHLDIWGKLMWPTANLVFTCFENECQQELIKDSYPYDNKKSI